VIAPAVRLREWRFQKGPLCLERGIKKVYEDPRRAFGPRWKDIQNWLEFLGRLLMPEERELTAPAQLSVRAPHFFAVHEMLSARHRNRGQTPCLPWIKMIPVK
jgi:hypothetical protein